MGGVGTRKNGRETATVAVSLGYRFSAQAKGSDSVAVANKGKWQGPQLQAIKAADSQSGLPSKVLSDATAVKRSDAAHWNVRLREATVDSAKAQQGCSRLPFRPLLRLPLQVRLEP